MHICFITHEYPKKGYPHGGIGSFLKTIAPELIEKGFSVSIVGLNYNNNYEFSNENGIQIHRLNYFKLRGLSWFFAGRKISNKIREINSQNKIDIVESGELNFAFIKKIKTIKYVIRLHGGHHFFAESENRKINFWKGLQEKKSFKKADAFIAVSEYVKNHTQKFLSYNNKPIELINYPINTELFKPINSSIEKNSIVFMGSICEKKGVKELVESFAIVKKQFPFAVLKIYGRDWYYPNGKSFTQFLKEKVISNFESQISQDILFKGVVNYTEVPLKYAKAHVCVFPSHMETQGLVAPEAMATEKCVVFTEKGPGKETIMPYKTGLLCNPFSPQDIAEKIMWVFSNEEESKKIAIEARKYVISKYSLNIIIQKNINFYSKLTQKQ